MKTDKELLELAAKAAGIAGEYRSYYVEAYNKDFFGIAVKGASSCSFWNSLTDSGDAFRLAVKLDMQVTVDINGGEVWVLHNSLPQMIVESLDGADIYEATRLTITRAAAAIGESK